MKQEIAGKDLEEKVNMRKIAVTASRYGYHNGHYAISLYEEEQRGDCEIFIRSSFWGLPTIWQISPPLFLSKKVYKELTDYLRKSGRKKQTEFNIGLIKVREELYRILVSNLKRTNFTYSYEAGTTWVEDEEIAIQDSGGASYITHAGHSESITADKISEKFDFLLEFLRV